MENSPELSTPLQPAIPDPTLTVARLVLRKDTSPAQRSLLVHLSRIPADDPARDGCAASVGRELCPAGRE
jgi:hypothetical protein